MERFSADLHREGSRGIYTLIVEILEPMSTKIGSLGIIRFPASLYLYTGSALGPGGVEARVGRHLRCRKRLFWHIDHLTVDRRITVVAHVAVDCLRRMECRINQKLASLPKAAPILRFGASDCNHSCASHLIQIDNSSLDMLMKTVAVIYLKAGLNPIVKTQLK
jgi:Uri superfamily endonuclease